MKTATVRTLRNDYATLLRRVEQGEEIGISRRGKLVARLVPISITAATPILRASAARRLVRTDRPLTNTKRAEALADSQGNW